jgi:hypothetical protein
VTRAVAPARHAHRARGLGHPAAVSPAPHPARETRANGGPAVGVSRLEFSDDGVVIARLREARGPEILRIDHPEGDGAMDWQVEGRVVQLPMDDFGFSIATADEALRDGMLALHAALPA